MIQTVPIRNRLLGENAIYQQFPDFSHLLGIELAGRVVVSAKDRKAALPKNVRPMKSVFSLRNPFKILGPVVELVSVLMVRLHAIGTRTKEGGCDEYVYSKCLSVRSPARKADYWVQPSPDLRLENVAVDIPHTPLVRDFVEPFVPNDRKPFLFGHDALPLPPEVGHLAATRWGRTRVFGSYPSRHKEISMNETRMVGA